ncbi:MAG: UDP-4-amino-4,6-dideoxy-N-acetyl-beta-L-altrosamine transaminase [Gammaproteobacteria bacterium]|nr:UDP-4-amino-4,6-dideoxy-N-acetyl-beta-L-altrosamine transaminase [Gammaproteobacteria bacterium]
MIPYARQHISQDDIDSITAVLQSDWLTQGSVAPRFEQAVADYCGAKYAISTNSATSALHLACLAAGLGPDDRLWTSANTFVASANCGRYCGAQVDFVDIDPDTYCISPSALDKKLSEADASDTLPKVVIAVHFAGQSCDMQRLHALSQRYGFLLIEDAAHAIGGEYQQQKIGGCAYSDMTVFSFHAAKVITTAEGGMIVTNSAAYAEKLALLRSHGITRNPQHFICKSEGEWYYEQHELGYNYRMNEIQAALGLSQLQRLDEFVFRRRSLAACYQHLLDDLPVKLPWQHPDTNSAWHLYVIRIDAAENTRSRAEVYAVMKAAGIGVNVHYIPVHIQPYYRQLGFCWGDYPEAERHYQEVITLPLFFTMTDAQLNQVAEKLREALS